MGPGALDQILKQLPQFAAPEVLVGLDQPDDAGVYQLSSKLALVQTVDFFTPIVDDPYRFGQIAAANALSDVYAMGGQPLTALNILCYPVNCGDLAPLQAILQGGAAKIKEAQAQLLGGHTVEDPEPKYGLAVTGVVSPEHLVTNQGAQPGEVLVLTKPLGTGTLVTALKGGLLSQKDLEPVIQAMTHLNQKASALMVDFGVRGATDITGFGLLGHGLELALGSKCTLEIWADAVPLFPQSKEMAKMGLLPAGLYANQSYLAGKVDFAPEIAPELQDLLFDPQTSGGLLLAVPEKNVEAFCQAMAEQGETAWVIGRVGALGSLPLQILKRGA